MLSKKVKGIQNIIQGRQNKYYPSSKNSIEPIVFLMVAHLMNPSKWRERQSLREIQRKIFESQSTRHCPSEERDKNSRGTSDLTITSCKFFEVKKKFIESICSAEATWGLIPDTPSNNHDRGNSDSSLLKEQ